MLNTGRYSVLLLTVIVLFAAALGAGLYEGSTDSEPAVQNVGETPPKTQMSNSSSEDQTLRAPRPPKMVSTNTSANSRISVGERTTITFELTANENLSNINISATEPLGVVVNSAPREINKLSAGETINYEITVTPKRKVTRTLYVVVESDDSGRREPQRVPFTVDALNESSSNSTGTGGDETDTSAPAAENSTLSTDSDSDSNLTNKSNDSLSTSSSHITVNGQAAYTYTDGGGDDVFGLSAVKIELYDIDGTAKQLAETTAGEDGSFSFSVDPSRDSDGDNKITARVVIYAENDAAYVTDSSVYNFYADSSTLAVGDEVTLGSDFDSDGSKELISAGDNAPYQAADWAYDARQFALSNGVQKSKLPIRYPETDWASYYYTTAEYEEIRLADRSDYDWDDYTMYHEYGHGIHFQLIDYEIIDKGSYSCHTVVSKTDRTYSLVEGFAEYYEAAVSGDPNAVYWPYSQNIESNEFYDTEYTGECANNPGDGSYDGLQVEGTTASILWELTDGDEPFSSPSFSDIADILENNPQGMNEFYNQWDQGNQEELDAIYTEYGIDKLGPRPSVDFDSTPYTSNSVTLEGSVTDNEAATETLELSVDGSSYEAIASGDGSWSASRTLSDGSHTVQLKATDIHGNTNVTKHTVRVSSEAPSTTLNKSQVPDYAAPGTESEIKFTHQTLFPDKATVTVFDESGSEVTSETISDLEGTSSERTGSTSVQLPTELTDGTYDIEVVVKDESGRTGTADETFVVDTTLPTIENVSIADTYVNSSTPIHTEVAAVDTGTIASGVDTIKITHPDDSSRSSTLSPEGDSWNGTFDPNETSGSHTAVVNIIDAAGNVNETIVSYEVDNEPPTVNGSTPRFTNASSVTVSGNITDQNLTSAVIRTNRTNGTSQLLNSSGQYSESVDLERGSNRIIVEASDAAENSEEFVLSVGRDETAPTGNLSVPGRIGGSDGPGATNQTNPTVVLTVSDNLADIDETATSATAHIDGDSASAVASRQNGTISVESANLSDGTHQVTVDLVDRAGNSREVTESFVVDTVQPDIDSIDLHNISNTTVLPSDDIPVTVNTTDDRTGVGTVTARESSLTSKSDNWNGTMTAPLGIGNRTIEIAATDAAGNIDRETVTVHVGQQQTIPVSESGNATGESPSERVNDVTLEIATDDNGTEINATNVDLTSAVSEENPEDKPVPDDHVAYYPQHDFNVSSEYTEGGHFNASVLRSELKNAKGLPDTIEFWVFNESSSEWKAIEATEYNSTDEELAYRVETPHYSTFAVSSDVDETAPNITREGPSTSGDIETDELRIRASFNDTGSGVNPNATEVTVDNQTLNLSSARTLTNTSLDVSQKVNPGNHTFSIQVADQYGNKQTKTWNVTVTEPSSTDEGDGGGGGGGGGGSRLGEEDTGPEIEIISLDGGTTVRLSEIPRNGQADINPEGAISGEPFTVSHIQMNFRFDMDDFRIETTTPRVDSGTAPNLPIDAGTPVGYLDMDIIGIEDRSVTETRMHFSIGQSALPSESSLDDLTVYQRTESEWVALDTDTNDENLVATLETTNGENLAVAADVGTNDGSETNETSGNADKPETNETSGNADKPKTDETSGGTNDGSTEASAGSDDSEEEIPGFGISITILALLSVVALLRRP